MTSEQPPGIDAIRAALQQGDVDAVLTLIERDLSGTLSAQQRYALHLMRARLLTVIATPDEALADFDAALTHASSDAQRGSALLSRAELTESAGWTEDARADISEALPLLEDFMEQLVARHVLGRIERDHGDLGVAIDLLQAVREAVLVNVVESDGSQLAEVTLDLAMALRLTGDTDSSIELLESLIDRVEPLFAARILIQIGTTYGFAGRPDDALSAYARALPMLSESSERAIVRYNRAVVLREQGRFDDARQELERALIENAAENARVEFDALLLAGIVARELVDFPRSLDFLREASERQPEGDLHGRARLEVGVTLAATGLHGPAIEEFGIAAALFADDEDRSRAFRYRGVSRNELGLLDAALDDFESSAMLTADPDERARGQSTRAALLASAGRWTESFAALDDALASVHDPALSLQLLVQRGTTYSQSGRLNDAVVDLERAIESATAFDDSRLLSRILLDLGAIYSALDEQTSALSAFERAVTHAVEGEVSQLALLNLGNLHVSRGEPDEALRAFDRAIASAADDRDARATAFLARANAFLRWGRYGEADTEFKRILTLQPSTALLDQSGIGRRTTEHHLRHIQQTRDELTKMISAMDQADYRVQPLLQRGILALAAGDVAAAVLDATRATRLARMTTDRALAFGHLALIHASAGECDDASAALNEARALDPSGTWLAQLAGEPGWLRCRHHSGVQESLQSRYYSRDET